MSSVILTSGPLKAVFLPHKGMNLISYSKGTLEVIDQNTKKDFEERAAGLGSLIGPHFHTQRDEWIKPVQNESLFPNISFAKAKGYKDPFSHGIGRYAPWNFKAGKNTISAHLSGKDTWNGVPLSALEGVDFEMSFDAELTPEGLEISLAVSSERLCLIGLHYYYALPKGKAIVTSVVKDQYNDMGQFKPMQDKWTRGDRNHLEFNLSEPADYGFLPYAKDHSGEMHLKTSEHQMQLHYQGESDEVSCQLYHPKNATFVCIEPISAKNPRNLSASSSSIKVSIKM